MATLTKNELKQMIAAGSARKEPEISRIVSQDEIPELHKLKTVTVGDGDGDQGVRLPQVGSIRKLIIKVDTSGASFTGGTSPAFDRTDFILKSFKINFDDEFFGSREPISGTLALQALRQIRRTKRAISSTEGEYIIEFPSRGNMNAMLPAGHPDTHEFSFDYSINSVGEVTSGSPTAFSGVKIIISAERYQTVYPPNMQLIYSGKTVTVSATGDLDVEYNNNHAFKLLGFVSFNSSDALADVINSIYWENNGRRVTYLEPDFWRAYANDRYSATPSDGIIFHEPETPLLSDELKAVLDISDASTVELYYFTIEVM